MLNNSEVTNLFLPYNSFIKKGKVEKKATILRIQRNYDEKQKKLKSNFYVIYEDNIIYEISFFENSIKFNITDNKNEDIIFEDNNGKEMLLIHVKHELDAQYREKFIKTVI